LKPLARCPNHGYPSNTISIFLSKGWIDAGITLLDELEKMRQRYDAQRTERIISRMLRHYRRLVFINMGYHNPKSYRQFSRKAAKVFKLDYQEIRGTPEFLSKICNGPWDDDFVVAPAGHTIRLSDFKLVASGDTPAIGRYMLKNGRERLFAGNHLI
jgi:Protein of unknown function (DUF1638)